MLIEILRTYIIAFIEIFIAINIIADIPIFLSLTEKYSHKQKKKIIRESILYVLALIIIFILLSNFIFKIIGITASDFKMAGGILLFFLTVKLLFSKQLQFSHGRKHASDLGIFPLAAPQIASPALFVISLFILGNLGILVAITALILNLFFSWFVLEKSESINKFVGERGIKSFSKIFEIILAAMAIMMIRQGVIEVFFK